jgi:hypothetical protein
VALAEGWYGLRRPVEAVFVILIALAGASLGIFILRRYSTFFRTHRILTTGLALTLVYCALRTVNINHVVATQTLSGNEHGDIWILEAAGVVLMVAGAADFRRQRSEVRERDRVER